MFNTAAIAKLIFALGIVNVVTGTLLFLSCRCIPGLKISGDIMKVAAYKRFYKYHCYLWWILWPSVIIHAVIAFLYFGFPF
ncbi:MAG: hypothetical protein P8105_00665 [Dehalococcoidia bacterium]